jgi:S1-C subfamily serine protease
LKIDVLRGREKLSFSVRAFPVRDRLEQFAAIADPIKSHVGPLAILGLDIDYQLGSLLPNAHIGAGVLVIGLAPGFNHANTGLRVGDVIRSLNRLPIGSVEQLKSAVAKLKSGDAAVLQIERLGRLQYLAFEME